MFGCHTDLPDGQRLDEVFMDRGFPFPLRRCPMRLINTPDIVIETVCELAADYQAGVIRGWPEAYPAGLVDGVRYVQGELNRRTED